MIGRNRTKTRVRAETTSAVTTMLAAATKRAEGATEVPAIGEGVIHTCEALLAPALVRRH